MSTLVLLAVFAHSAPAQAVCAPAGTNQKDMIVCNDTDTVGVAAKNGNDSITVSAGASVSVGSSGSATAIDAGAGNDTVVNNGQIAVTINSNLATAPSSACPTGSSIQTIGVAGGGGSDQVTNHGAITAQTTTTGAGSACAASASVGVLGSSGNDRIENTGSISANASGDAAGVPVTAKGVAGANGNDVVINSGSITVAASSIQKDTQVFPQVNGFLPTSQESVDNTLVTAVSIEGGNAKDDLRNDGTLTVNASVKASSVTPSLTLTGGDNVTATTTLEARAVGIDSGNGKDSVSSTGTLNANASAEISGISVDLSLVDLSHASTNTTVSANATGIDTGNGKDDIAIGNTGSVNATATSKSSSVGVVINAVQAATADSALQVQATATGLRGGAGKNTIDNSGAISATATAQSSDVAVSLTYFDLTIADRQGSDTSTSVQATATGIDGTKGQNWINVGATGTVNASANASAKSFGFGFSAEGVPSNTETLINNQSPADIGITSTANATGIAGGAHDDYVTNAGSISASATASAKQDAVSLGMGFFEIVIPAPDIGLVGAGTAAEAHAIGIDGGSGNNSLLNSGVVKADASASSVASGSSISLSVFSVDFPGGIKGPPLDLSLNVADVATTAQAQATGITAGSGDDYIRNTGTVQANAAASGGSISVSATVSMEFEKDEKLFGVNAVAARAVTEATAQAVGIDGGDGYNQIRNEGGNVTASATASGVAVAAGVAVSGTLKGSGGLFAVTGTDTSTTATATATGIRGGEERDLIYSNGSISSNATANVTSVSASIGVAIAKEGVATDVDLARARSTAIAEATGVDGAGGHDDIGNMGSIVANANATANAVSVSVSIAGTKKGVAGAAAVADAATTANATAVGIKSGGSSESESTDHRSDYYHDNSGSIVSGDSISANADARAVSVSASVGVSIAKEGVALGTAIADTSTHATATAKGIEGNGLDNDITNEGNIGANSNARGTGVSVAISVEGTAKGLAAGASLVESSVNAQSASTGIDGGAGDDGVMNHGTINVNAQSSATAVGVSAAVAVAKEGAALDAALTNTSAKAESIATGVNGGAGNDMMSNDGTIATQNVSAHADAVSVSLDVALSKDGFAAGAALAKSDTNAHAAAVGLDGGSGSNDLINNSNGTITLQGVNADALAVSASVAVSGAKEGAALSAALVDVDATASAQATGIAGGNGNDSLTNLGSIVVKDVTASGIAVGVSVGVAFAKDGVAIDAALAETGTTANANAKGIDGGDGYDRINNEGSISLRQVKADATAVGVSVSAAAGVNGLTIAAGLADASGKASASATGLDGGDGDDSLSNKGRIETSGVGATANAAGISIGLSGSSIGLSAGAALANTSGNATATAKGIDGGAGSDSLENVKDIVLSGTGATANAVSVGVSVTGNLSGGVAAGAALTKAGANANATAIGIDGGDGNDYVMSGGMITVDGVSANALAVGVSAQIGITNAGVSIGAALADTHAEAAATAKGLAGGGGDDSLWNAANITMQNITADARGVGVSVAINGAISGGVAGGVSLTDGRSLATATAIGIEGGSGNDDLYNSGNIKIQNVEADAHATGVSVTLSASFAGLAGGASLADTSATARVVAKGMDGGDGDDKISNMGTIDVHGKAKADAQSISVSVQATLGVAGGGEITHSNTTAEATVVGIDGGSGRDEIANSGNIKVDAQAETKAASISIGVSLGIGGDVTLSDAKSTATATAIGIDNFDSAAPTPSMPQGYGNMPDANMIDNRGRVDVTAGANSTGTSVGGNLFGLALGDTTNAATSTSIGIRGGDGRDDIHNGGTIIASSNASASGLTVNVTLGGKAMGDASSTASATSTGIQTGGNDDEVVSDGAIGATANTQASTNSVSVGLIGSSSGNASTRSLATAVGIDGGAGRDELTNNGNLQAIAIATATANGTRVNIFGVSNGDVSTAPTATAIGISGDTGDDMITHTGSLTAIASASTGVSSGSWQIGGSAGSKAGATSTAVATGLDGGDGNNSISNRGTVLTVRADASASASSSSWTLAGTANDVGTLTANALATGIGSGEGNDYVRSETVVSVLATSSLNASGGSDAIFGNAGANTQVGATSTANGINVGGGTNSVENSGTVSITAKSDVTSNKSVFSFAGSPDISGLLAARSRAGGIVTGGGDDTIGNAGQIGVGAVSTATVTNGSSASLGGSTSASGSANVDASAVGIDAGDGRNMITNSGSISVSASASPVANNDSSAGVFFSNGGVVANATASARATGIGVGNGDNAIDNSGSVNVSVSSSGPVNAHAAGGDASFFGAFGGNASASGNSSAFGDAAGIRGGNGNQRVYNSGTIDVALDLSASVFTDPNAGDTGGSGSGNSNATAGFVFSVFNNPVRATGIAIGDGASTVVNTHAISVAARPVASAGTDADGTLGGRADGVSTSNAAARAAGIQTGNGAQLLVNDTSGTISVTAQATTAANIDTDAGSLGGGSFTLGVARSNSTAVGIGGGNGDSRIANNGSLTINSTATSTANVHAHGGAGSEPTSNGQAFATANGLGVEAGNGNNVVTNTGTTQVTASAFANVSSTVDRSSCFLCGGDNTALGDAISQATAVGLRAGNGNNQIQNDGKLSVGALASSALNWDGDGDDNHRVSNATATAIGIDAGTGNNVIVNRGTITVTALALASNNGSLVGSSTQAIGIRTGDGNDAVVNAGTITTSQGVLGLSRGTAISTGGGDDTVTLKAGSVTNGDIDLGSGTNKLILEGTPTISGSIIDATSTLTLSLSGAGSFGGSLPAASVVKNGAGTFTLPAMPQMDHLEVDEGTLKLQSDYTFKSDGTFQTKVQGNGSGGQFSVDGSASLAGAMKITRGTGAYVNGTTYDVLTAGEGIASGTKFSSVESPDDTRLVKFHADQMPDRVRVTADVASFTTVAQTANQMAIAQNLDRVLPASTGQLNQTLGVFQSLSDNQFVKAFASMSPSAYLGYSAAAFNSTQQYTNLLQERMASLHTSDAAPVQSAWTAEPIRLAYAGRALADVIDAREAERERSSGLWIRGFSQKGDQDPIDGANGFGYKLSGATIGYDRRWSSRLSSGFSVGSVRNKVKADIDASDGSVDTTLLSLYGGYFERDSYFTGTVSVGRNRYDARRNIVVGPSTTTVSSNHDGDVHAVGLVTGWYSRLGAWAFDPYVSLQYTKIMEDAFAETGSGAGLNVGSRTSEGIVSALGARVARAIEADGGSWMPQANLAWLHDFGHDAIVNASYVDAPDASFSISGQPVKRNGALLGLGIGYRTKTGFSTSLNYNGEFRDGFRASGFVGELRFEF